MENHYATLGVPRTASAAEIRNAYRRLAIKNHPDRNPDPRASELFRKASEAYEVLGDPQRRKGYDIDLGLFLKRQQERTRKANPFPTPPPTNAASQNPAAAAKTQRVNLSEDLARLSVLFSRGRYPEAESLAHSILNIDSRQPVPYALLADLARMDGRRKDAARLYALAIQMDPDNAFYQRRYEEVLAEVPAADRPVRSQSEPERLKPAFWVGVAVLFLSAIYVCFAKDQPDFRKLAFISSWSLEFVAVLFFSGFAIGSSLVACRYLDRFASVAMTSDRALSSNAVIALFSLLNFWLGAILFGVQGMVRGSFPYTMLRFMGAVAGSTLIFALAASIGSIQAVQALLWGGNVIAFGTILGWVVADAFR